MKLDCETLRFNDSWRSWRKRFQPDELNKQFPKNLPWKKCTKQVVLPSILFAADCSFHCGQTGSFNGLTKQVNKRKYFFNFRCAFSFCVFGQSTDCVSGHPGRERQPKSRALSTEHSSALFLCVCVCVTDPH